MRTAFNIGLARDRRIYLGGLLLAAGLRLLAFAAAAFLACVLPVAFLLVAACTPRTGARSRSAIGSSAPAALA